MGLIPEYFCRSGQGLIIHFKSSENIPRFTKSLAGDKCDALFSRSQGRERLYVNQVGRIANPSSKPRQGCRFSANEASACRLFRNDDSPVLLRVYAPAPAHPANHYQFQVSTLLSGPINRQHVLVEAARHSALPSLPGLLLSSAHR